MIRSLPIKNIILVSSIALFFGLFTLTIIYIAQGKKVTEDGRLIDTSIIVLRSNPEDVDVYINDKKVNRTGNRVEGVEPGEIKLRLEKEGYNSWEKIISLEPKKVKEVNAKLFPNNLLIEKISDTNVDKIAFNQNSEYLFYTVLDNENDNGVWRLKLTRGLLDFNQQDLVKISSFSEELTKSLIVNDYSLIIPNGADKVIILESTSQKAHLFEVNNQNQSRDLVDELGYFPDRINWFRNSDSLIISKENIVFEYDVKNKQKTLIYFNPDKSSHYSVSNDKVFFVNNEEVFQYLNKNTVSLFSVIKTQPDLKGVKNLATSKSNNDFLIVNTASGIFFIDTKKSYVNKFSNVDSEIKAVSNDAKSIVYESNNILYATTFTESFDNNIYESKTKEVDFDMSTINRIYFSNNNDNLIIVQKDKVDTFKITASDSDGQNPFELDIKMIITSSSSQISEDGNFLYLLLKEENSKSDVDTEQKDTADSPSNIYKISLKVK